jgi:rhamnose utilization protein RhaD (predicted bifunctional aldolase and dehydrogenase)
MLSRWRDADAQSYAEEARRDGLDPQLGLRIYTSKLIGQDPDLVLHGGGNTSVKVTGAEGEPLMHIKGSGWDLDTIAAPGLPAVRLTALLASRGGPALTDPEMVALLRQNLVDPAAPNPSVEALLHAFIDHTFVDHTHSSAVLALANQADMRDRVAALYGDRVAFVPYVMPGYDLSMEGGRIYDAHPGCEGLWLENHGLFTFGPDAATSFELMIEFVSIAEAELARTGASLAPPQATDRQAPAALLETLRHELDRRAGGDTHVWDFRSTPAIRDYLALPHLDEVASRGTATPDHVIRIKPFPLILEASASAADMAAALDAYAERYTAYFERNAARASEPKTMLDPLPRVALVRGHGVAGIAKGTKAAAIAADLAEQTCRIVHAAERYGRFRPLEEADLFDMEYWSLEQAKLQVKKP